MGTAKWRLVLWRYNLKIWARKREGERRSDLNDTNIAWPARTSGPCGRKKVAAYFFYNFRLSCGVFPTFWELVFARQLLSGVEKACRYVDRTGYQRRTSGLCSKMPPTAIWRLFVHTPIAGATDSDRFSRGWVPLLPRWVFLRWRQGKVKRERLKLLDLKTYCQFCSHKRKTVLLVQSDAGLERKKVIKRRLCTCHSISAHDDNSVDLENVGGARQLNVQAHVIFHLLIRLPCLHCVTVHCLASSQRLVTSPRKGTTSFPSTEAERAVQGSPTILAFNNKGARLTIHENDTHMLIHPRLAPQCLHSPCLKTGVEKVQSDVKKWNNCISQKDESHSHQGPSLMEQLHHTLTKDHG